MKNILLTTLAILTLILGGLCWRQHDELGRNEERITELEKSLRSRDAVATKAVTAEKKVRELKTRLSDTVVKAAEKSSRVVQLEQKLAEAAADTNKSGDFAAMFKSPEMKEMIKAQQKAFMGPMMEKSYSAYFQALKLTDEQKSYLKDLLGKKMMVAAESGMEMFGGDIDDAKRKEMVEKIKTDTEAYDRQIKEFLGEANYEQFQGYEKTLGERMQLSQFRDQSSEGDRLNPDQESQLLQAMVDERSSSKAIMGLANAAKTGGNPADMFSDENLEKFATDKAQVDQRVLARAQQILSPAQYSSFETFLNAQREMQIMGMKMGAKMLAPKGK